ncbi:MAG: hypothetical protein ACYC33_00065 [Thermoleophilia bacterium]
MRIVLYVVIAVIVLALIGVAAVLFGSSDGGTGSGPTTAITDPAQIDEIAVAFVQNPYNDDYGMMRIVGYLDNFGSSTIVSATLEIQLLGDDGGKKELVTYEVADVAPGARRTFDANAGTIDGSRTVNVKIAELRVEE